MQSLFQHIRYYVGEYKIWCWWVYKLYMVLVDPQTIRYGGEYTNNCTWRCYAVEWITCVALLGHSVNYLSGCYADECNLYVKIMRCWVPYVLRDVRNISAVPNAKTVNSVLPHLENSSFISLVRTPWRMISLLRTWTIQLITAATIKYSTYFSQPHSSPTSSSKWVRLHTTYLLQITPTTATAYVPWFSVI